jgi:hypothetical protein
MRKLTLGLLILALPAGPAYAIGGNGPRPTVHVGTLRVVNDCDDAVVVDVDAPTSYSNIVKESA